jgi:hypothetical protein
MELLLTSSNIMGIIKCAAIDVQKFYFDYAQIIIYYITLKSRDLINESDENEMTNFVLPDNIVMLENIIKLNGDYKFEEFFNYLNKVYENNLIDVEIRTPEG